MNPDGLQRFANWVNTNKSEYLNSDKNDREFNEHWPKGRTNHYWFDMNRDWLPIQLPESKARINTFHKWHPNVLTDHHEMGTNSTFFYQPGVPSRVNPLTPKKNQELTQKIGRYHEAILSKTGSLFYRKKIMMIFIMEKVLRFLILMVELEFYLNKVVLEDIFKKV